MQVKIPEHYDEIVQRFRVFRERLTHALVFPPQALSCGPPNGTLVCEKLQKFLRCTEQIMGRDLSCLLAEQSPDRTKLKQTLQQLDALIDELLAIHRLVRHIRWPERYVLSQIDLIYGIEEMMREFIRLFDNFCEIVANPEDAVKRHGSPNFGLSLDLNRAWSHLSSLRESVESLVDEEIVEIETKESSQSFWTQPVDKKTIILTLWFVCAFVIIVLGDHGVSWAEKVSYWLIGIPFLLIIIDGFITFVLFILSL